MKSAMPARPKALIISGSYPHMRCGVGDYVEKLIENLRAKDVDAILLTSDDPLIKRNGYINALIKKWNIFSSRTILSFIKKERPDFIHLQLPTIRYRPTLSAIGLLPALSKIFFKNAPLIVTVHDFSISRNFLKIFFLPIFLFSDGVIVTNEADRQDIVRRFPFLNERLKKIHIGPTIDIVDISDNRKKEIYRKIGYTEDVRFITTFGFVKKDRCIDKVIKVFNKLKKEDEKLKLIVLGWVQDKKYRNCIFELVDKLSLKGKICFLESDNFEELSFCLSLSSLAILLYERGASFRRSSLINYAIRKIPVVTNLDKRYGVDDELIDSGMVLTTDSMDVDEIYEKTKVILYDADFANRLREKMENAKKIFNWGRIADETIKVYSELINKKKST